MWSKSACVSPTSWRREFSTKNLWKTNLLVDVQFPAVIRNVQKESGCPDSFYFEQQKKQFQDNDSDNDDDVDSNSFHITYRFAFAGGNVRNIVWNSLATFKLPTGSHLIAFEEKFDLGAQFFLMEKNYWINCDVVN